MRVAGAAAPRILALKLSAASLSLSLQVERGRQLPSPAPRSRGDGTESLWPCSGSECFPCPAMRSRAVALQENGVIGWTVVQVERLRSCMCILVTYVLCFAKVKHK